MTWAKIDDHMPEHPKIVPAGPLALALQVRAICYCARHLTDGFLPALMVGSLTYDLGNRDWPKVMTDAELWEYDEARSGFIVHDYLDYNPSKAEVQQTRAAWTARAKKGAASRWGRRHENASKHTFKHPRSSVNPRVNHHAPVPVTTTTQPGSLPLGGNGHLHGSGEHSAPNGGAPLESTSGRRKSAALNTTADFRTFYEAYPRHKAPDRTERAFRAALKRGATLVQMLAAIDVQRRDREAGTRAGEFVPQWPYPSTWLNGGSWLDESRAPCPAEPVPKDQGADRQEFLRTMQAMRTKEPKAFEHTVRDWTPEAREDLKHEIDSIEGGT